MRPLNEKPVDCYAVGTEYPVYQGKRVVKKQKFIETLSVFIVIQDRQFTYNVTLGCVRATIVAVEKQ